MTDSPATFVLDWAAAISVVGAIVGFLPAIAAGLGAVWYIIQIYEWYKGRYVKED